MADPGFIETIADMLKEKLAESLKENVNSQNFNQGSDV